MRESARIEPMAPCITDFGKLFEGIPEGAWVAIAQSEERIVAYANDLSEAIQKARELGEPNPIVARVPHTAALAMPATFSA